MKAAILALSFLTVFALLAPVVPLSHSWPSNAPPPSAPMAFHGSLSWAAFQVGVAIDGNGNAGFHDCFGSHPVGGC